MRRFHDDNGGEWTVAVSAGSYGSMTLMFAPAGDSRICWLALEAENAAEAQNLLDGFSENELCQRLAAAEWWQA